MRRTLALLLPLALLSFAPVIIAPEQAEPEREALRFSSLPSLAMAPAPDLPAEHSTDDEFTVHDEMRLLSERARLEERRQRELEEIEQLEERQERLSDLGWYEGQVDGIAGPMTVAARGDFQAAAGIEVVVEEVTEEYVEALFSDEAPRAPEPEPEPEPEPKSELAPAPEPEPESEPTTEPAPAATSGVPWDRIAECESGGNWAINTGNGYYGGLQFNKESWDWAGGQQYAAYPHEASREQQIATAEKLLSIHPAGLGAWPACTKKLGLR